MSRIRRLDAKWLRRWTIRLGVAAAVVLVFPFLTVVALISVVGIPLGFAMLATPTVFVVLALASVAQRLLGRDGPAAVGASLALALIVLAGVARLANARIDEHADALLAGDLDTIERPLRAESIGLASFDSFRRSKGEGLCDETCQRLLLSGSAQRVLVAAGKPGDKSWTAETPALAYRFEQRAGCPPVHLSERRSSRPVDDAKPAEAMRLAIASGRCLVESPATLADADAVITTGRLSRGASEYDAGLSLAARTVTARRASVHLRAPEGFVERYRWTGLTVLLHPVIPVPTLTGGVELNMRPGFARVEERRNTRDFANEDVDVVVFLRDELGLGVAIPSDAANPAGLIARALDGSAAIEPAMQRLIEDFFRSLTDAKKLDEPVRLLAFRALADPRVVAPRETWALVRACKDAGEAVHAELARILFAKLKTTDPALREDHPSYLGWPAAYLAQSISMLPPRFVLPYRRDLEELARDPERRQRAYRVLTHLPAFGSDAVPTLLFLVDEGIRLRANVEARRDEPGKPREDWQTVYRSGLAGLCRLGNQAPAALPPLMAKLRGGTLAVSGGNRDLLIHTLVVLGADPQELRSSLAGDESERAHVDREIVKATAKPSCTF